MAQNTGSSVSGHNNTGQFFTASCAGDITQVTVWFNVLPSTGTNQNDRVLHIRDGDLCTSPILHTEPIPLASIVVGANVFTLSTPVPINMGEINSWEITDVGQTSNAAFGVAHNSGGLYAGGNSWYSCSQLIGLDATFEVQIGEAVFDVDLGIDTTVCPGQGFTIDAGYAGGSYLWNTGESTQTITVNTSGTYGVAVTDSLANITTDSIVVNFFNQPVVDLGVDQDLCMVDSICLSVAPVVGSSYMWNDTIADTIFCTVSAGTYWIACTDSNSCVGMDTINITANVMPIADITTCDTTNCPVVQFTDGSTNNLTWDWNFGDGNTSSLQNPSNTYLSGGSFTVSLVVTNNCGSDSIVKNVDITCYAGLAELGDWDVLVYPNVNSGNFQIEINGMNGQELEVQLYSTSGKLVYNKTVLPVSNTHVEDVKAQGLSNGMYVLKLSSNENMMTERIVISE